MVERVFSLVSNFLAAQADCTNIQGRPFHKAN